jgi:hypothetical protein
LSLLVLKRDDIVGAKVWAAARLEDMAPPLQRLAAQTATAGRKS